MAVVETRTYLEQLRQITDGLELRGRLGQTMGAPAGSSKEIEFILGCLKELMDELRLQEVSSTL